MNVMVIFCAVSYTDKIIKRSNIGKLLNELGDTLTNNNETGNDSISSVHMRMVHTIVLSMPVHGTH